MPCRRILLALQDKVKNEIDYLVEKGILARVEEPTDWVNQMAVVEKANHTLRICIDLQPLNLALKREHFKLPNFNYVLHHLQQAKVLSKVNANQAFCHVKLDYDSSLLTIVITL